MQKKKTMLSVVVTLTAAVCCFAPALVVLLDTGRWYATLAWLAYVLLPMLSLGVAHTFDRPNTRIDNPDTVCDIG